MGSSFFVVYFYKKSPKLVEKFPVIVYNIVTFINTFIKVHKKEEDTV